LTPPRDDKDDPGMSPPRPAKLCLEGPPREQCYVALDGFGWNATVKMVQLSKERTALLFSAATGGVSGWSMHLALLTPGTGKDLDDLLPVDLSLSNQSQTAFWSEPVVSGERIFVTADAFPGPGEAHYSDHRYVISTYIWDVSGYWLADRYISARWHNGSDRTDVLGPERPTVIARLRQVVPGIRQRDVLLH
jgi:hypothetical protein